MTSSMRGPAIRVPHGTADFEEGMLKRGFDPADAPFEIRREWRDFPVVQASIETMKAMDLRVTL
jgi:hypothetical protein